MSASLFPQVFFHVSETQRGQFVLRYTGKGESAPTVAYQTLVAHFQLRGVFGSRNR